MSFEETISRDGATAAALIYRRVGEGPLLFALHAADSKAEGIRNGPLGGAVGKLVPINRAGESRETFFVCARCCTYGLAL